VTGLATIDGIASTIIQPFFSLYLNQKGVSPIELGIIISIMAYTTLATRIPLGLVMSRFGVWWVVPLALIGHSLSYIFYSLASSPIHFCIIRVFHAVSMAALQPTLMSLASQVSPEGRRGEAIGMYLTSVGLAMMGGPLLCSLLLSCFEYRTVLMFSSIIPFIALLVYFSLLRSDALGKHLSKNARGEKFFDGSPWRLLKPIVKLRSIQSLSYLRFTFGFAHSIIDTLYGIFVVNILMINPASYALFLTLNGLANTLFRLPAGRISDIVGRKRPYLAAFITLTIVFLLFSEVKEVAMIGLAMFLLGMAHGVRAVSE